MRFNINRVFLQQVQPGSQSGPKFKISNKKKSPKSQCWKLPKNFQKFLKFMKGNPILDPDQYD